MRINWKVKPNKSLCENAAPLLSSLYDQFMSHAERVIRHPRLTDELHRMRIDGKPLRYMMEIFEPILGPQYRKCFEEVKNLLELLGKIHDCDVTIPIIQNHLQEIRLYNQNLHDTKEKFSTRGIRQFIRQQREQRSSLFDKMCIVLQTWQKVNFREKLLRSLKQ